MKTGFSSILFFLFISMLVYACASIGTPEGGDYDIAPPGFVRSSPEPNSVNFSGTKIELTFDEYISLDKPNEKVIITPPQLKNPIIKSVGKKVTVELKDSLIPDITYTLDFTNSIVDNNEKNPLEGFTFAFSTGDVIDSLAVSGLVLNAENMEPMPNILVGLHVNPDDSMFTTTPFTRTSMTNERGQFWIRNIAPGSYRLFALEDVNRNYIYNYPDESMAFLDSLIIPGFVPDVRTDTIWADSITVDTIKEIHYNRFIPDDLVLYLSKDAFTAQYMSRPERLNDKQFVLKFGTEDFLPPKVYLIEDSVPKNNSEDWYVLEYSNNKKDLTYWITDSTVYKRDTLRLEVDYTAHDSVFNPTSYTDTLQLILRNRQPEKKKETKKGKEEEEEKPEFLDVKFFPSGTADIFDTVKITFGEPLKGLDLSMIHLEQKVDTLWESREFSAFRDSLNPRVYYLDFPWNFGQEFQLGIDSATIYGVYEHWNDSLSFRFKIRNEDEYGDLYIKVSGNEAQGFGELLDTSDKMVRKSYLYNGDLIFENLKPGKYYLRYIEDRNGNGKWDPGNYSELIQPEEVYYYDNFFEIRKYAQWEQSWDIKAISRTKQKPLDITKNKPVEKKSKRDEQQQKNEQKQRSNTTNSVGRTSTGTQTIQQSTR